MTLFSFFCKDLSIAIIKRDKSYKSARLFFWREREREGEREREREREREGGGTRTKFTRGYKKALIGSHFWLKVLALFSISLMCFIYRKKSLSFGGNSLCLHIQI